MNKQLLQRAIEKFGRDAQIDKIQEEAMELALALHHLKCPTKEVPAMLDRVYEELADMKIMMEYAEVIFDRHRINKTATMKFKAFAEKYGLDDEETEGLCPRCECCSVDWFECTACGGEGATLGDELVMEDPMWYSEDDTLVCGECGGKGGHSLCLGRCDQYGQHEPDYVQAQNPRTGSYVLINRNNGKLVSTGFPGEKFDGVRVVTPEERPTYSALRPMIET